MLSHHHIDAVPMRLPFFSQPMAGAPPKPDSARASPPMSKEYFAVASQRQPLGWVASSTKRPVP